MGAQPKKEVNSLVKQGLELGPPILFFVAYLRMRDEVYVVGGTEGYWYEKEEQICFAYEDLPEVQCWQFFVDSTGNLLARFEGNAALTEIYQTQPQSDPLICKGPEIGV